MTPTVTIPRAQPWNERPCYDCRIKFRVKHMYYDCRFDPPRYYCGNCLPVLEPGEVREIAMKATDKSATYYHDSALEGTTDEPQIELHANYRWEFANFTTSPASERRRLHSDNHGAAREADEALRREYRLTVLTLVVFGLLTFGGCFALLSTIARQKAANELTAPGFDGNTAPVRALEGRREAGRQ